MKQAVWIGMLLFSACSTVDLPEGRYDCTTAAECPKGWFCHGDKLCYSRAEVIADSGMDASGDAQVDAAMDAASDATMDATNDASDPVCVVAIATVCDPDAACTSTNGIARCSCPSGYVDVSSNGVPGTSCADMDECRGTDDCADTATCTNTRGSYSCACNTGFEGDGKVCEDKCVVALRDRCDPNALCTQMNDAAVCRCRGGYVDTSTAQDGSECTADTQCMALNCDPLATCDSGSGSPQCACPSGYTGNGTTCTDIDECNLNTDDCGTNATCTNNSGGFLCACTSGFAGDGHTCTDVNECTAGTANCHARADCNNRVGSYTCACQSGYSGDGATCSDIDECAFGSDTCANDADCMNTTGSFTCACKTGFTGNGMTCTDVNECLTNNGGCGSGVTCVNNLGGPPSCGCAAGFTGTAPNCVDINECTSGANNCSANAACANTSGSFTCACNTGYTGNGVSCADTNECTANTDNCGTNATCTNTPGAFTCACNSGYMGNGVSCADVDECATNNGGCGSPTYWTCTNTAGSRTCADINECTTNNGGCGNATYYSCANNTGYAPTCTDINECLVSNGGCGSATAWTCGNVAGAAPTCTDVNECLVNNGACGSATFWTCTNTAGSRTCSDINECATNNGGCDSLTTCVNNAGAIATCGACPAGYVGTGAAGCAPTLTGLMLSSGTLSPVLSSGVTSYAVSVGLVTQTITLTPTVPTGTTIAINGQAVAFGANWTSSTLNLGTTVITIVVSQSGHPSRNYTFTLDRNYAQHAYVKASNTDAQDGFGYAVALSGDGATLAVGATGEDSNAMGINGNQANNSFGGSGAVYIFTRSGSTWNQQAYIKASDTYPGDLFGSQVALSSDGSTLAVGAASQSGSGAVYVFTRSGSTWNQQALVTPPNRGVDDNFGFAIAVSADGGTLAVGARLEDSNATGINGNQADNSALNSGAVYVFTRSGSVWSQQAYVKASNTEAQDRFGTAVALSVDGGTLAVGAEGESSNATGINGNQADNSASNSGAVYVFTVTGSAWSQQAYVKASTAWQGDSFGVSIALSADGGTLAVGADYQNFTGSANTGAVYVFTRSGSVWNQQAYIRASNGDHQDVFGWSVALSGDGGTLAVGARNEDSNATGIDGNQADNSLSSSGAVYVLTRSGSVWSQQAYIKASNTGAGDFFGYSIALSADGGTLAVGADSEDSNATGINGNQADNSASSSGAVYVFR